MFENRRKCLIQHCERSESYVFILSGLDKNSWKFPKLENSNATFVVIFKHCAFISNFVDIFPRDNLSNSHALSLSISDMFLAQVHFGMQFLHFYISWQKRFCFRFSKQNFLSFFIVANKRRSRGEKCHSSLWAMCEKQADYYSSTCLCYSFQV